MSVCARISLKACQQIRHLPDSLWGFILIKIAPNLRLNYLSHVFIRQFRVNFKTNALKLIISTPRLPKARVAKSLTLGALFLLSISLYIKNAYYLTCIQIAYLIPIIVDACYYTTSLRSLV